MRGYTVVSSTSVPNVYAGTSVPGEFRPLTDALGAEQVAATLIRVPPHSDFEQGTSHVHRELEKLDIATRGQLAMRFGYDVVDLPPGTVARVAAEVPHSHRNLGDEPVELWAISRRNPHDGGTKIDAFWARDPDASPTRRRAGDDRA